MTLKIKLSTALLPLASLMLIPAALNAQAAPAIACAPYDAVVAKLKGSHKEQISALGLTANGHVMQIFSTQEGQTWTLLSTSPAGMTCVLASGKYWQTLEFEPTGPAA